MSTRADTIFEGNVLDRALGQIHIYSCATYCARVDSNTVILVVALGAGDDDVSAIANVKAVSVFAQAVARLVIDRHVGDG